MTTIIITILAAGLLMSLLIALAAKEKQPEVQEFVTQYDDKLRDLGVKQQFDINLHAYFDKNPDMIGFCLEQMEAAPNFNEFMKASFIWHTSIEGQEFWYNIAKR